MDNIDNIRDTIRKNINLKINRKKLSTFISKVFNTQFTDKRSLIYAYLIYKYNPKKLNVEYAKYI